MSFWQNLSRGLGLKADSLPSEPYQSDDPYKNPQNMDSGGYTDRLPRGQWALDYQYLANKNAEQRRQALWSDAQNVLRQGTDMMQTYRAGGSAALASGVYGQRASLYGTQAMNTEAPDLLIAWRDRLRQQADVERQQANSFTRAMAVWNGTASNMPLSNLLGASPSSAQGAPAQLGTPPASGDGSSMSLGAAKGGGGVVGMPGGGGGGGGIVGQPIGGGGVGGGLFGGSVGAPGSAPAVDGSTPVGRAGNAIIGGDGGGGGDGAANAAHGYNTSSGMKGDKVGKRIIGGGGGGGAGGGGPGGMETFTHGEAAGRAMGAASPQAQGGVYQSLAGDPGAKSSTYLMQVSGRDAMGTAIQGSGGSLLGGAGGGGISELLGSILSVL